MSTGAEDLLRRDRAIVGAGLAVLVALAWLYISRLATAGSGPGMAMTMPEARNWGAGDAVLLFIMWAVMMVAMMLPSAAPVILTFTLVNRRRVEQGRPVARTGVFVAGYVVVWSAYSALAAAGQWALHEAALLSDMAAVGPRLGGALLIAAGLYQWTPLKRACLTACRSPLAFLMTQWREGPWGALQMGLRHGAYCVGCCWALMALLFVTGVMNLAWVVVLAGFVLVEKLLPAGQVVSRVAGVAMAATGMLLLLFQPGTTAN
jgi:predicted metal-binding membrane protein